MFKLIGGIPKENGVYLACSGGVDSMVVLDFLLNGKYKPTILHFDHGTKFGDESCKFVRRKCKEFDLPIVVSHMGREKSKDESIEEYWRNERYNFLNSFPGKVIMAHHLDDATEWWLFSCMHGQGKVMPYQHGNVIRPFLTTPKSELIKWAERKGVEYMDDPGNTDERYMRSIIRHKILPEALRVNPGLRTVVRKKIEAENSK